MGDSKVQVFFNRFADDFDRYYRPQNKSLPEKIIDVFLRRSMNRRFQLTIDECLLGNNQSILDVGCGSGRYGVILAKKGIARIVGIDFSQEMIKLAQGLAFKESVLSQCHFLCEDFMATGLGEAFDATLAVGLFDYAARPEEYLKKMKMHSRKKIIASFPAKWRLPSLLRAIRLKVLGCPLYFYTPGRIKKLFASAGIRNVSISNLGRDYFVVAEISS